VNDSDRIRTALERGAEALRLRPALGRGTAVTTATLGPALACAIEDGRWRLSSGMSDKAGGDGSGPDPGVLGRAALASCVAVSYGMWAARLGIPLDSVAVRVEADYDVRGELGVTDDPPGYLAMRCVVTLGSPAPDADLARLAQVAERHTPWLDNLRRPVPVTTERRAPVARGD
jgi:uncharacterized OsmC-like protein